METDTSRSSSRSKEMSWPPPEGYAQRNKRDQSPPLARFEKLDPSKQRFYFDERKVYSDGTEYSFEELRGLKWRANKQRQDEKLRTERLELEVKQLREQVALLIQLKGQDIPHADISAAKPKAKKRALKPLVADESNVLQSQTSVNIIVANSASALKSTNESKEAMSIIQDLWNGTLTKTEPIGQARPAVAGLKEVEPVAKAAPLPFAIFTDETAPVVVSANGSTTPSNCPNTIVEPAPKAASLPFAIFTDETAPVAASTNGSVTPSNCQSTEDDMGEDAKSSVSGNFDYSINPIAGLRSGDKTQMTFVMPDGQTEFINMNKLASTPTNDKQANRSKKSSHEDEVAKPRVNTAPIPAPRSSEAFTGGLTGKLSPINETSREYKSSSSCSSGAQTTCGVTSTTFHQSKRNRILSGQKDMNPFDGALIIQFLDELEEPLDRRRGFHFANRSLPKLKPQITSLKLGQDKYLIHDQRDEGSYAKIYAAQLVDEDDDATGITMALSKVGLGKWFALKVSKPPNAWEFYICDELQKRMTRSKRPVDIELSIMCVNPAVLFKDATVLVDELCPNGSIIRVMNALKFKNKQFPKALLGYFVLELLLVVKEIHAHHIIHADLKPDNVLVVNL